MKKLAILLAIISAMTGQKHKRYVFHRSHKEKIQPRFVSQITLRTLKNGKRWGVVVEEMVK